MKPGTYTQIYIQVVFSPMHREGAAIFSRTLPEQGKLSTGDLLV